MGNRKHKQHPEVTDQLILDHVLAGMNGLQIRDLYGFSNSVVTQRVRRLTGMTPTEYKMAHGWANQWTSPETAEEVARLYEDEWMVPKNIATHLGITITSVLDCLHLLKIEVGRHRFFPPETELTICSQYQAGENCVALGREYGVHEKTIRCILKRHEVKRRGIGGREPIDPEKKQKVLAMIADGYSTLEAGEAVGLTYNQVTSTLATAKTSVSRLRGEDEQFMQPLRRRDITIEQIAALREEGLSIQTISQRLGCDRKTVARRLRRAEKKSAGSGPA